MQISSTSYYKSPYMDQNISPTRNLRAKNIAKKSLEGTNEVSFSKIMSKVDNFLNLGADKNLSLDGMNEEEKAKFLQVLAKLMKEGIIGYQYYEVDGKIEKHFLTTSIGDRRLYNATPKYDFNLNYGKMYA